MDLTSRVVPSTITAPANSSKVANLLYGYRHDRSSRLAIQPRIAEIGQVRSKTAHL